MKDRSPARARVESVESRSKQSDRDDSSSMSRRRSRTRHHPGRSRDASPHACQDGRTAEGQLVLDLTMQAIQASLDGLAARQRISAQNLANSETPGYTAQTVSFEDSLSAALAS